MALPGRSQISRRSTGPLSIRIGGKSVYYSHLLVAEDAPYQSLEDTFGGRISWTIENSQSGFNAVRSYLLGFRSDERPKLYQESIGPIGTFTVGVEGIRQGEIDVVPIDSFSHDLMSRYTPEKLAGTRIIATTPASPFPPLVAAHDMPAEDAEKLRKALYRAHEDPLLQRIFRTLMLDRFDPTSPDYYEPMLKQAARAEAVGYMRPG